MAHPRPFSVYPPKPLKHSGGARIKIQGIAYYLGKHGSEKSYREYERLRAAHANAKPLKLAPADAMTVDQLVYRWISEDPRGKKHREVIGIARACEPLCRLFGPTPAAEFTAARLIAVQESLLSASWMTDEERTRALNAKPWSRQYINKQIKRIVRVFRGGESAGHLPRGTWEHLRTITPLRCTDKRVRNAPKKAALDWQLQVEPVLKVVSRTVASLIRLQFLSGMRPQDAVAMRPCDLDPNGPDGCWLYRPGSHKGEWRGHELVKVLGPAALEVIRPWLDLAEADDDYLFQPSKRRRGQPITVESYSRAVARGCRATGVRPWSPAMLRHAAATEARRIAGDVGVKAFLGHEHAATGKLYGKELDLQTAAKVANAML